MSVPNQYCSEGMRVRRGRRDRRRIDGPEQRREDADQRHQDQSSPPPMATEGWRRR